MKKLLLSFILLSGLCGTMSAQVFKGIKSHAELSIGSGAISDRQPEGGALLAASFTTGYQFNSKIFLGAGAEIERDMEDNDKTSMAFLGHFRSHFLESRITPFFDMKGGYAIMDNQGWVAQPSVGCRFALRPANMGISVSVGYKHHFSKQRPEADRDMQTVMLRVGMDF